MLLDLLLDSVVELLLERVIHDLDWNLNVMILEVSYHRAARFLVSKLLILLIVIWQ